MSQSSWLLQDLLLQRSSPPLVFPRALVHQVTASAGHRPG